MAKVLADYEAAQQTMVTPSAPVAEAAPGALESKRQYEASHAYPFFEGEEEPGPCAISKHCFCDELHGTCDACKALRAAPPATKPAPAEPKARVCCNCYAEYSGGHSQFCERCDPL